MNVDEKLERAKPVIASILRHDEAGREELLKAARALKSMIDAEVVEIKKRFPRTRNLLGFLSDG